MDKIFRTFSTFMGQIEMWDIIKWKKTKKIVFTRKLLWDSIKWKKTELIHYNKALVQIYFLTWLQDNGTHIF